MSKGYDVKGVIARVVDEMNMTVKAFAEHMGISYDRVFSLYSGRTKTISRDIIEAMSSTYKINPHFILTGNGPIFNADSNIPDEDPFAHVAAVYNEMREAYRKSVSENDLLKTRIELLEKENELLKQKIDYLEKEAARNG